VKIPAPHVDVVDATGAGDCLAGALCHFLAGGRLLEEALRLAVVAASLSTRGLGANGALPTEGSSPCNDGPTVANLGPIYYILWDRHRITA